MSAGLDTSTVTPGNTAPELSLTTPATDACAYAAIGTSTTAASASNANLRTPRMPDSLLSNDFCTKEFQFVNKPARTGSQGISDRYTFKIPSIQAFGEAGLLGGALPDAGHVAG